MARTTISTASAVTSIKSERQPTDSTSKPEREGPTAGAKPITKDTMPMALPRFSRGNIRRITVNTIGITTPVAAAWKIRPSSRMPKKGENAAIREPKANTETPAMKSFRVGKRPIRKAESGMTMASTKE